MKKYSIYIVLILFIAVTLWAASLNNPYWVELSTEGRRTLKNKNAIIVLIRGKNLKGIILGYTSSDIKVFSGSTVYIVPLSNVKYIIKK